MRDCDKRIAAVVFDMDGLMLDTEPIYKAAWQEAANEIGFPLDDQSYLNLVGRPTEDCESELIKLFGAAFPLAPFQTRWTELWRKRVEQTGIPAKSGLTEMLSFLEEQRVPFAVATSSDLNYTEFTLEKAGLSGRFDIVVTRDHVAAGKPAPDVYLEAAKRLCVDCCRCVALEDSNAGILAASRAGMLSLLIPDLQRSSDEAVKAAYRVLSSLHEARQVISSLIEPGSASDNSGGRLTFNL